MKILSFKFTLSLLYLGCGFLRAEPDLFSISKLGPPDKKISFFSKLDLPKKIPKGMELKEQGLPLFGEAYFYLVPKKKIFKNEHLESIEIRMEEKPVFSKEQVLAFLKETGQTASAEMIKEMTTPKPPTPSFHFILKPEFHEVLFEETKKALGQSLILVVNDKVLGTPVLHEPIEGGTFVLMVEYDRPQEAIEFFKKHPKYVPTK